MTRTELLTAAIHAEVVAGMAGTRKDALNASAMAWAYKIAELVITERIDLIPEA